MIVLKHPANIGGRLVAAGSLVKGLTPEQEERYIRGRDGRISGDDGGGDGMRGTAVARLAD